MAMVSAIQEAQKDNLGSFNDYMMKVLQVDLFLPYSNFWVCFFIFGHDTSARSHARAHICRYFLELHFSFKIFIMECLFWTIHPTYFIRIFLCVLGFLTLIVS